MTDYPHTICWTCGKKYGRAIGDCFTVHDSDGEHDVCGWCGGKTALAAPRDFGYPEFQSAGDMPSAREGSR